MEEWNPENHKTDLNSNGITSDFIEQLHKLRQDLLSGIRLGDQELVSELEGQISRVIGSDQLNILKRVPNNKIRAFKNILLSHNTLYSYAAELGGLSPWQSHFMSEKYAIIIEHAETVPQLEKIHTNMMMEYADPAIRFRESKNLTIVEKAENFIETNFAEDLSIEEIAEKLHVHPSHLMRSFKKEKGITISHYRNVRRIKEAKELILHTNLSMTEIAFMIGFNNSQYFSKFFKEHEGLSPIEFKKGKK